MRELIPHWIKARFHEENSMHFWFKKIVALFFYPLPASLLLMVGGIVLLWLRKRETIGKSLVTAGIVILLIFSTPLVPNTLLSLVESRISPCKNPANVLGEIEKGEESGPLWVVVLGQGYNPQDKYPYTLRTNRTFTKRLTEAVRIHKCLPESRLLISVAGCATREQKDALADGISDLYEIDRAHIELIYKAHTTRDEIRLAREKVGDGTCFLVSEALHLPRALALSEAYDLKAVPAPSEYLAGARACTSTTDQLLSSIPNPTDLRHARRAIHECLGLVWAKLVTGSLDSRGIESAPTPKRVSRPSPNRLYHRRKRR